MNNFFQTHWNNHGTSLPFSSDFRTYLKTTYSFLLSQKEQPDISFISSLLRELISKQKSSDLCILLNNNNVSQIYHFILPFLSSEYYWVIVNEKCYENYLYLIQGSFSSYIVEQLIRGVLNYKGERPRKVKFLEKMYNVINGNLIVLMKNKASSFVIRTFLEVLGKTNKKLFKMLKMNVIRLLQREKDLIKSENVSIFVCDFLKFVNSDDEKNDMFIILFKTNDMNSNLFKTKFLRLAKGNSYLIESFIINTLNDKQYGMIFNNIFKEKIEQYSISMNYVLSAIILRCNDKAIFKLLFDEMILLLRNLWNANAKKIIQNLLNGCIRFNDFYNEFMEQFLKHFNVLNDLLKKDESINSFGCRLLSTIYYKFPAQSINDLNLIIYQTLKEDKVIFKQLSMNKNGIDFLEKFFTLFSKNRGLILLLKNEFNVLAKDMLGYRIVEKFLLVANKRIKHMIAKEIIKDEENVRKTKWGNYLYSKFKLYVLKTKTKNKWLDACFKGQANAHKQKKISDKPHISGRKRKRKVDTKEKKNPKKKRKKNQSPTITNDYDTPSLKSIDNHQHSSSTPFILNKRRVPKWLTDDE